jgi:hypothetical protein
MSTRCFATYFGRGLAVCAALVLIIGCEARLGLDADADIGQPDASEVSDGRSDTANHDGQTEADTGRADAEDTDDADTEADAATDADGDVTDASQDDTADISDDTDASQACPSGEHDGGDGQCVATDTCSQGFELDAHGVCVTSDGCPVAFERDASGRCVSIDAEIPFIDAYTGAKLEYYYDQASRGYLSFWDDTRFFISKTLVDSSTWISTKNQISDCQVDRRSTVWIDEGEAQMAVCHFTTVRAFDVDGTKLWDENIGNFNYMRPVGVSIDADAGHGYLVAGNQLRRIELSDGSVLENIQVRSQGIVHIDGNRAFVNGRGWVSGVNLTLNTEEWDVTLDSSGDPVLCASGAITSDGDFITFCHDTLARFAPDGTIEWERSIPPLPGPGRHVGRVVVLTGNGDVLIPTGQPAVAAYDAETGRISWVRELPGHAGPLVAGDSGNVYAYAASIGRVYVLDSNNGSAKRIYDGVAAHWDRQGVYDLALRDGLLYVAGGHLSVIDVESQSYDPGSNWPTAAHDNQRTGNTASPLDY